MFVGRGSVSGRFLDSVDALLDLLSLFSLQLDAIEHGGQWHRLSSDPTADGPAKDHAGQPFTTHNRA
jgi:hypothetical protein